MLPGSCREKCYQGGVKEEKKCYQGAVKQTKCYQGAVVEEKMLSRRCTVKKFYQGAAK